jgi:hypothetical protein
MASLSEALRRATEPPVPQLVVNSLMLGLEVGAGVLILAWLLRPDPGTRLTPMLGSRLVGRFALMPPLVQGVGLLALLVQAAQMVRTIKVMPGLPGGLAALADLGPELAVQRNPWPILVAAVGLSVGLRLLRSWQRAAERRPEESRSGLEAALVAGPSRRRARALAALRPARWVGGLLLGLFLAAVNLAPALLFTPWMDGRSVAPAILVLADAPDGARVQAAALACCAIAGSLAALGAARLASAPPPEWDPDPP